MAGHVWRLEFLRRSQVGFSAKKTRNFQRMLRLSMPKLAFEQKGMEFPADGAA